ncbi:4-carboxymuconolactone decarboxylase [Catenuloplanes nepalensis]|uniref:4-carboxymuconolactone decarboxylase n=1 Tax=Catenuloplanes nepalensis TaxID=587533 RepID=A0ABT9MNK7_9ACTN|nr:carboxymuconolactone decarboxylase family protein [Catenuloplanes nepalensis]MDP9792987.1 4-carboxymuconolactone decarboxylase [Catenuloplanes nepalensis]
MTTRDDGFAVFRRLLPDVLPDGAGVSALRDGGIADELGVLSLDNVFGTLWTRPGLDPRSRSLVTLGILIALRATDELRFHFPIALRNGLTRDEIAEVIYHASGYAGFPAAATARTVAVETLDGDA